MKITQILKLQTLIRGGKVAALAVAFAVAPLFAGAASADGNNQTIHVSGTFQTSATSTLCDGIEDCVVDDLFGSFEGGTNRLITVDFVEGANNISYEDATRIDTNGYGIFEGTEHGIVNIATEEFHSVSVSTSIDGCGSKLILRFEGTIDLDSEGLEDAGTYEGVLIKKIC